MNLYAKRDKTFLTPQKSACPFWHTDPFSILLAPHCIVHAISISVENLRELPWLMEFHAVVSKLSGPLQRPVLDNEWFSTFCTVRYGVLSSPPSSYTIVTRIRNGSWENCWTARMRIRGISLGEKSKTPRFERLGCCCLLAARSATSKPALPCVFTWEIYGARAATDPHSRIILGALTLKLLMKNALADWPVDPFPSARQPPCASRIVYDCVPVISTGQRNARIPHSLYRSFSKINDSSQTSLKVIFIMLSISFVIRVILSASLWNLRIYWVSLCSTLIASFDIPLRKRLREMLDF